jgi:nitrite reductase/ring-hydroxylating ferredoxin subunit
MTDFRSVAKSGGLAEGQMAAFEVSGHRVAVANVDGSFHAFGDVCTHKQCSLAEGELDGTTVTCPCHGSQFDVTTGQALNPPATEPVPVFGLRVDDDDIQVDV